MPPQHTAQVVGVTVSTQRRALMMWNRPEGHVELLTFNCRELVPFQRGGKEKKEKKNRGMIKVTKVLSALVLYVTDDFTEERLIARGMKVATIISL